MDKTAIALIISGVSIGISFTTLFWNIYKEMFLKPRARIRGRISYTLKEYERSIDFLNIEILNLGPGTLVIENIVFKETSVWKKIFGKAKAGYIIYDSNNPINKRLPISIGKYETANQFLIFNKCNWLEGDISHLGIVDILGRELWIKRNDLKKLKKAYKNLDDKEKDSYKDVPSAIQRPTWLRSR